MAEQHVSHSTIFTKADWLEGVTDFTPSFANHQQNVFVEAPTPPEMMDMNLLLATGNILIGRNTYKRPIGILSPNLVIGRYTSIAQFAHLGATNHNMHHLTMGVLNSEYYEDEPEEEQPYTIIGCDVWIGLNAVVINGVNIGHGSVIGAGSVVTKDIPPYSVAVGSPARVIKTRFSDEIIADLMELKWWTMSEDIINRMPYKDIKESIAKLRYYKRKNQGK